MVDNTINDAKTVAGSKDMILAGRYHILRRPGQGGMERESLRGGMEFAHREIV